MKTAIITTTINVPKVVSLYPGNYLHGDLEREAPLPFHIFIAGDHKTPEAAYEFCKTLPNTTLLRPSDQGKWKCSELIGWNCIQRRNIALLEALAWGADIIISIDDDNIPLYSTTYVAVFQKILTSPFNGPEISGFNNWFDPGQLLVPPAKHRGFPITKIGLHRVDPVASVCVGVAAGAVLGDPDVDAVTRAARRQNNDPPIQAVSALLQRGATVSPQTATVFNSQNTAFIRELAPLFFMLPGVGRYDDIWASLIMQAYMRERGLRVHLGPPFVWQERNEHDLGEDLRNELLGMAHTAEFWESLSTKSHSRTATNFMRESVQRHPICWLLSVHTREAAMAWCDDIEQAS